MTPAAFGVIHAALAALEALDADLTDEHLDALNHEDLADAWNASGTLCRTADHLHDRLRSSLNHARVFTPTSRNGDAA